MGVRGVRSQQQRPVQTLYRHGETLACSLVGLALCTLAFPVGTPVLTLKSASSLVVLQQFVAANDYTAGVIFAGGYVAEARVTLEDERASVETERDAFEQFADEVQSLALSAQSTNRLTTAQTVETGPGSHSLADVRQRYRETVMSVPDYDSEYGETLAEHLTAEFNSDVASVVVDGDQFTRPLKQLLVRQAHQSARERDQLLDAMGIEENSLEDSRSRLDAIDSAVERTAEKRVESEPFPSLVTADSDIRRTRRQCERLLEDRQGAIHRANRAFSGRSHSLGLQEYLYRDLDVTFPILTDTIELLETLEDQRSDLIRTLSRRE